MLQPSDLQLQVPECRSEGLYLSYPQTTSSVCPTLIKEFTYRQDLWQRRHKKHFKQPDYNIKWLLRVSNELSRLGLTTAHSSSDDLQGWAAASFATICHEDTWKEAKYYNDSNNMPTTFASYLSSLRVVTGAITVREMIDKMYSIVYEGQSEIKSNKKSLVFGKGYTVILKPIKECNYLPRDVRLMMSILFLAVARFDRWEAKNHSTASLPISQFNNESLEAFIVSILNKCDLISPREMCKELLLEMKEAVPGETFFGAIA